VGGDEAFSAAIYGKERGSVESKKKGGGATGTRTYQRRGKEDIMKLGAER